jgi:VWFA-related protein
MLPAQSPKAAVPAAAGNIIRTETKLVLVDAVVTDKKGNYVRDLTAKDFRVWEDKTEQMVKSFSLEGEPASGAMKQYVVFFFDDTSMSLTDQTGARKAAAQFVAANFGANRMMAVADYGGALKLSQSLTADPELLAKALREAKQPTISTVGSQGAGASGCRKQPGWSWSGSQWTRVGFRRPQRSSGPENHGPESEFPARTEGSDPVYRRPCYP